MLDEWAFWWEIHDSKVQSLRQEVLLLLHVVRALGRFFVLLWLLCSAHGLGRADGEELILAA